MNAVEIKGLTWKYSNTKKNAIESIDLVIPDNTFTGIIGPNESGKTTLLSCIKGIIPNNYTGVYHGEISLFGKNITDYTTDEMAQIVGIVFSDPDSQFTAMSVEEEIAFGLENIGCSIDVIKERIEWVSELTDIKDLLEKPPYDLSGGQKQRVAIASVLAMRPRIVMLDEPTSMLDPVSKEYVFSLLEELKQKLNLTIIVVEHNVERLVELSDNMILMQNSNIVRHEPVGSFFDDIEAVEATGVRVPDINRFMYDVEKGKSGIPVHFTRIKSRLEEIIRSQG